MVGLTAFFCIRYCKHPGSPRQGVCKPFTCTAARLSSSVLDYHTLNRLSDSFVGALRFSCKKLCRKMYYIYMVFSQPINRLELLSRFECTLFLSLVNSFSEEKHATDTKNELQELKRSFLVLKHAKYSEKSAKKVLKSRRRREIFWGI